jgi:hypothetical protein
MEGDGIRELRCNVEQCDPVWVCVFSPSPKAYRDDVHEPWNELQRVPKIPKGQPVRESAKLSQFFVGDVLVLHCLGVHVEHLLTPLGLHLDRRNEIQGIDFNFLVISDCTVDRFASPQEKFQRNPRVRFL